MPEIGIGIVGGGYMGKAHAVAMSSVGAIFDTKLRPRLEMVAATSPESAERYRKAFGHKRSTGDWRELVADPKVEAIVIASVQSTHREITEAAAAAGKPILCEKPLGASLEDARAMVAAVEKAGVPNMVGFNYIRTPASQYARQLIEEGAIGEITFYRGEHTEDFFAHPEEPATWRVQDKATGNMGDLMPHPMNCAMALAGPIKSIMAEIETVHATRPGPDGPIEVKNDDHAQLMVRFASGAMGHIYSSRVAGGRKMGYAYDIYGTKGSIRFDQEDQNALWLYQMDAPPERQGFQKILAGPAHPDYLAFCQGPGHGTGYQDTVIIEAKDFLLAIETGEAVWPTFRDGLAVSEAVEASWASHEKRGWVDL